MMKKAAIQAGWGHADITPYGRKVALQGQANERITSQVHDPLYATVLAVDSGEDSAIVISADLSYIDEKTESELRAYVQAKDASIDVSKLFAHAVHVHTAPYQIRDLLEDTWGPIFVFRGKDPDVMTPEQYRALFSQKVGDAVVHAWQSRKPARAASTLGYCTLGHNRRVHYRDGVSAMYGPTDIPSFDCMEGGEDSGVELLYFFDMDGKPTGCVANCCCPSQMVGGQAYISGDIYAQARREVWAALGDDFHLLPILAAAGDIAPGDLTRQKKKFSPDDEYDQVIELARRLSREVEYRLGQAKGSAVAELEFAHRVVPLRLPMHTIGFSQFAAARKEADEIMRGFPGMTPDELDDYPRMIYYSKKSVVDYFHKQKARGLFPMDMHVIRIGDCALVTNPFELFLDYGLRIKGLSRASHTMIAELSSKMGGYLPTEKAMAGGSYSAGIVDGFCGPEGGRMYVRLAVEEINALFEA